MRVGEGARARACVCDKCFPQDVLIKHTLKVEHNYLV